MTEPTTPAPKTKKKPGPKPRKGTDAALALRALYEGSLPSARSFIRSATVMNPTSLRMIADAMDGIDEDGRTLAADLFDVVDKRAGM